MPFVNINIGFEMWLTKKDKTLVLLGATSTQYPKRIRIEVPDHMFCLLGIVWVLSGGQIAVNYQVRKCIIIKDCFT